MENGTDCCSWHGVTCDTISGHVVDLNLGCESVEGEVPIQISHLSKLESLHLSMNGELVWKETTYLEEACTKCNKFKGVASIRK
ncbi:receptor-like protein [Trifolium medium]|uniref:Receptor-like protein n=1 Tax=Trifolium medium TaxID=97028 RepID=A0A392MFZ4_9FABA|nr:receptor-like protein [Trifolium medium]